MIDYITLKNFKSLNNVTLDLRDKKGKPKKMAFIYGENGSGKSNLISALYFITQTFDTLSNQESIEELKISDLDIDDERIKSKIIEKIIKQNFFTLKEIIQENKTIGSDHKNMEIELGFFFCDFHGVYTLKFDNNEVINEELKFIISERSGVYFKISKNDIFISPTIFYDKSYKNHLQENIEKYWGKHTFISIIINEIRNSNKNYIKKRIDSNLLNLISDLRKISVLCKYSNSEQGRISIPYKFLRNLEKGMIKDNNDIELKTFEEILNTFFTSLYSDIKKAYYKIEKKENNQYQYKLYFSKIINNSLLEIPYDLESTGTQKLLSIFPFIFSSLVKGDIFVDEIESGIHDVLITTIIEYLSDAIKGQFIATTHNTLLMSSLPQEYIYIIQSDPNGNKKIVCIKDYNFRTQNTNNKQIKYLHGAYKGIPYTSYIDFEELADDAKEHIASIHD